MNSSKEIKLISSNIILNYKYDVGVWLPIDNTWYLFKRDGYVTNPNFHQILCHPLLDIYKLQNHNNYDIAWMVITKLIGWNPVNFLLTLKIEKIKEELLMLYQDKNLRVYKTANSITIIYKE